MTATPGARPEIAAALTRSHDPDWEVRCDAAQVLRHFPDDERVVRRLVEMLGDPDNLAVTESAASALCAGGGARGVERIAAVFDALDDQAAAYTAVTVSDAIGDPVFVTLLAVITGSDDPTTRHGALDLGALIGMQTSPQWEQAVAASR